MKSVTTFNNAAIKALPSGAVNLISAPGAGNIIIPFKVVLSLSNWVANYTNITASPIIWARYAAGTTIGVNQLKVALSAVVNLLAGGQNSCVIADSQNSLVTNIPTPKSLAGSVEGNNKAFEISFDNGAAGNLTGGDATTILTITVYYEIQTL
jgi:hypothetical protein